MITKTSMPLAALVLAGGVLAQLPKGADAPAFAFKSGFNGAPESFDELYGKVVILDFAETW